MSNTDKPEGYLFWDGTPDGWGDAFYCPGSDDPATDKPDHAGRVWKSKALYARPCECGPALEVGRSYRIGWNAAKELGDTSVAYGHLILEALGYDWAVFRKYETRQAYAVTWHREDDKTEFFRELKL